MRASRACGSGARAAPYRSVKERLARNCVAMASATVRGASAWSMWPLPGRMRMSAVGIARACATGKTASASPPNDEDGEGCVRKRIEAQDALPTVRRHAFADGPQVGDEAGVRSRRGFLGDGAARRAGGCVERGHRVAQFGFALGFGEAGEVVGRDLLAETAGREKGEAGDPFRCLRGDETGDRAAARMADQVRPFDAVPVELCENGAAGFDGRKVRAIERGAVAGQVEGRWKARRRGLRARRPSPRPSHRSRAAAPRVRVPPRPPRRGAVQTSRVSTRFAPDTSALSAAATVLRSMPAPNSVWLPAARSM